MTFDHKIIIKRRYRTQIQITLFSGGDSLVLCKRVIQAFSSLVDWTKEVRQWLDIHKLSKTMLLMVHLDRRIEKKE